MTDDAARKAWSIGDATGTADQAASMLGLAGAGVCLLRLGENAIFRLEGTDLVLRVARPGTSVESVRRVIEVSMLLRSAGVLVGEPVAASTGHNPLILDDEIVSVWRYYEQLLRGNFDYRAFGSILRGFHEHSLPAAGSLPQWDAFSHTKSRLLAVRSRGAPSEWIDDLDCLVRELELELQSFTPGLSVGVIHGDAHSGNALNTANGLILIDLDNIAIGPRDADFAPTLVQDRRFARARRRWPEVCAGYGFTPPVPLDSPLVRARELFMVAWLMQQYGINEQTDRELGIRVKSLRDEPSRLTPWNPH